MAITDFFGTTNVSPPDYFGVRIGTNDFNDNHNNFGKSTMTLPESIMTTPAEKTRTHSTRKTVMTSNTKIATSRIAAEVTSTVLQKLYREHQR